MTTGDQGNFLARLKSTLPQSWFGDDSTPILDGLLSGYAWAGSFLYQQLAYVQQQTRIKTATQDNLDNIAVDFFGASLPRRQTESDSAYRNRILINLIRERGTRQGLIRALQDLTGRTPKVFEPGRPADTGGYRAGGVGYSVGGGYGSLLLPCQLFVTAYRPLSSGIPYLAGYGISTGAYSTPSRLSYASITMITTAVADADIYAAIDSVKTAGTVAWTQIKS